MLRLFWRKMSPNDGAITTSKPACCSAHAACSRDEPQPKLRPATRIFAPAYSGRCSSKAGSFAQSKKRNSP